jgi:OOP family OmpA-OmpF porin
MQQLILEINMKNIKRAAKTAGVLSLMGWAVMSTQFVMAAEADKGWIGGLSVGQTISNVDDVRISRELQATGLTATTWDVSDHSLGFKLFAGYKFNKNFALEGGYFDLGKFSYTTTTSPTGSLSGNIAVRGLNLDAVGMLPFSDKWVGLGRVGLNYAEARDGFTSTGAVAGVTEVMPSKRALNLKVGLGLQYNLNDSVGMRAEWERYRINDAVGSLGDINMYSVGLVVKFGQKSSPKSVPVACLPPVLVIVPVAKTEKYCSILDVQFDINTEELQREDKEKLAVLGNYMKKYPDTTAQIEGHTDDVGTAELNMKLSKQRAESVVKYLESTFQINPFRMTAVGYGESRPIADNDSEEGRRQNRRIEAVIPCVKDIPGLAVHEASVTMALEMQFDQNKADIKPEYDSELNRVADFLKSNPSVSATVEGHEDNLQTSPEKAMKISQQRAQNVVDYLVKNQGVSRQQLSTSAFGESRRIAYNTSVEGEQENRRVNIIFNYAK